MAFFRDDTQHFVETTVGELKQLLEQLPDHLRLFPNDRGNLSIVSPTPGSYTLGFVDVAANAVNLFRETAPGAVENNWKNYDPETNRIEDGYTEEGNADTVFPVVPVADNVIEFRRIVEE